MATTFPPTTVTIRPVAEVQQPSRTTLVFRYFRRNKSLLIGLIILFRRRGWLGGPTA